MIATARRLTAGALAGLFFVLVFQVSSVDAAIRYKLVNTFGGFATPTDITIDQSNGNLYVTDIGTNTIDVVGPEGGSPAGGIVTPITGPAAMEFNFGNLRSQTAIDETGGPTIRNLYVGDAGHSAIDKFVLNNVTHTYEYSCQFVGSGKGCVATGTEPSWQLPWGVAVDGIGNVYISGAGPGFGSIFEFDSTGGDVGPVVPGTFLGEYVRTPAGIAVASNGTLYLNSFHRNIVELVPGGEELLLEEKGSGEEQKPTAVALDAEGHLFVDNSSHITEYNQPGGGPPIGQFGDLEPGESIGSGICSPFESLCSEGVAVYNATKNVYVTDRETGTVKVFAPTEVPDTETGSAENVRKTTATITGTVNPVGAGEAHYSFQYGTGSVTENETTPESAGSGSTNVSVEANLAGLAPNTTYMYRLAASNTNGPNFGATRTFTTAPAVTFKTCPLLELHSASATLCVAINPEGSETSYIIGYGLQEHEGIFEYENFTGFTAVGAGEIEEEFHAPITGLEPSTAYHYRVFAFNELGFTEHPHFPGKDEKFITPPADPTVNDQPPFATGISQHEATLHGAVNPGRGVTTYHFEYGTTTAYGSSTPEAYTELNYIDDAGEQVISGLQAGTTYHYRLVATNSSATTRGPDETFITLPGNLPLAETGAASQITLTTATIAGIVDAQGQPTSYEFEVGPSTAYGTQLFGSVSDREEVTGTLTGLLPATTYHYRLLAHNPAGTTIGIDQTFTTQSAPSTIIQPSAPAFLPIPVFPREEPIRLTCKKSLIKKSGKCVKKHHPRHKKHKKTRKGPGKR